MQKRNWLEIFFMLALLFCAACVPHSDSVYVQPLDLSGPIASLTSGALTDAPPTDTPTALPSNTPEPVSSDGRISPTHPALYNMAIPTLRSEPTEHTVQSGETITIIASLYQVSKDALIKANEIKNADMISVGQVLQIPAQIPDYKDPGIKIIDDSELPDGPACANFDTAAFLSSYPDSYIASYIEPTPTPIPDSGNKENDSFISRKGSEVIDDTSIQNSINPKILIALLEFQSQTLSGKKPGENQKGYEIVNLGKNYKSLSRQLSWASIQLNYGYYQWKAKKLNEWILQDDTVVEVNSQMNAGTAALQYLFSQIYDESNWKYAVSANGFSQVYKNLFGKAEDFANQPASSNSFPNLELPIPEGEVWSYTSGPHNAYTDGTPWGALDFAPPDALGCNPSSHWVEASIPGKIVYSNKGLVIEDLDGDGNLRTGWEIIYLHIATQDRIENGADVQVGDKIGHPSCEGGIADGAHVHFSRRYNGEWLPIDAEHPMILSGWEAFSEGTNYDGYLVRGDQIAEAWFYKTKESEISK